VLPKRRHPARGQHSLMPADQAEQLREQIRVCRMQLADAAAGLGTALGRRGRYVEAEPLLRRAVAIYEACCGAEHPRFAEPLSALSAACAAPGRPGEAERLSRRALKIIDIEAMERS
jgi:Flp pilus assembly protein TadD